MTELILLIGLFYPQVTLIVAYLTGTIPPNSLPIFLEAILLIFLPRILFVMYIVINYEDIMFAGLFFLIHLIIAIRVLIEQRIVIKSR